MRSFLFLQCLLWFSVTTLYFSLVNAQSLTNPIFWQVPLVYNTSNPLDQGTMVDSGSRLAVSQDFQVVNVGDDAEYKHKRILIDMSNGCSETISLSTIQQWNDHQLTTGTIRPVPKIALVERGECSWNKKVTSVSYLSLVYRLNIDALMIYDNDTHGTSKSFDLQLIAPYDSQKSMTYDTPLPFDRNITSMEDNDVFHQGNNSNTFYLPIYFTTKKYGLYLKQLDHLYSSSNGNASTSDLRQFYQIVPLLSTAPYQETGKKYDDGAESSSMLESSKGYLAYILALVAVFIIGAILLRYLKIRRMQQQISTQNEHVVHPNHTLHARANEADPLPVSIVNSLPIIYYSTENVKNATCCICLDDYVENKNQVRMLPCGHGFCVLCIDPWLTQKSTLCPICKYDCLPFDQRLERQQRQGYNTTTSIDDMDLSDVTIISNSVHAPNIPSNDQSTSQTTQLAHNQHQQDATDPLQLSAPYVSTHRNDVSQSTSEQNNTDASGRPRN